MSLADLFERIPGQSRLAGELEAHVQQPKNSYFFVGPHDAGVLTAAKAFAKAILCADRGCGECQSCQAIEQDLHPDVAVYERSGAALTVSEAREITEMAFRSTSGSSYQVIIVPEMELVGRAAPVLLKSVEEPPISTIFLLLASMEVPELRTLMSRSIVVKFDPLSEEQIYQYLIMRGHDSGDAKDAVRLSAGRWSRAVELVGNPELRERFSLWEELPGLLSKDISVIISLVDRLIGAVTLMEERRKKEQKKETSELNEMAKALGVSRAFLGDKLEEKHKRELRRIRTTELRAGLLLLEMHYRNQLLLEGLPSGAPRADMDAIRQIEDSQSALVRNCNEFLLLVALLSRLPSKAS